MKKIETAKIIYSFPILWEGWDCDSKAWVMEEPDGNRFLVMTNHGSKYEAKNKELRSKLKEYEEVTNKTRTALNLLNK